MATQAMVRMARVAVNLGAAMDTTWVLHEAQSGRLGNVIGITFLLTAQTGSAEGQGTLSVGTNSTGGEGAWNNVIASFDVNQEVGELRHVALSDLNGYDFPVFTDGMRARLHTPTTYDSGAGILTVTYAIWDPA